MKPKSPVQKNNLVVFPYEYTHVYPYRNTWYICIAMMIYTSLQEYFFIYPLIQQKSIRGNSSVLQIRVRNRKLFFLFLNQNIFAKNIWCVLKTTVSMILFF